MSAVKRSKVDNDGPAVVPIVVESPIRGPGQQMTTQEWSFVNVNALVNATKEELVESGKFNLGITVKAIYASRQFGASLLEQGVPCLSNFYIFIVKVYR